MPGGRYNYDMKKEPVKRPTWNGYPWDTKFDDDGNPIIEAEVPKRGRYDPPLPKESRKRPVEPEGDLKSKKVNVWY